MNEPLSQAAPMIAQLDLAALSDLKQALPRFAHKPLPHLSYLTSDQVEGYWLDEIAEHLADERSTAFASHAAGGVNALVVYTDSPWDTKVVGKQVAIIKYLVGTQGAEDSRKLDDLLAGVIHHAASRGIQLLTCKVQPFEIPATHALERHGFVLMDTLLDFHFDFSRVPFETISPPQRLDGLDVRLAKQDDLPEVLWLTDKAFAKHFGRYNADPNMPAGTGTRAYEQWARSSFGGWADWVLIAEIKHRIVGYSVWKEASTLEVKHSFDIAHCHLAGIHPDFFGKGLYTVLTFEGMQMAQPLAKYLDGPAHVSNYAVHRAMLKLGWKLAGARHSFHKWLPE